MPERATADADLLQGELLTSSGDRRYLLAAFCQPRIKRREHLEEAAAWLELDRVLRSADPTANMRDDIETRWLALLALCSRALSSRTDQRDLDALSKALHSQYAIADSRDEAVRLERLWDTAGKSLRGRRWIALRRELAKALAGLVAKATPESLLPREPRKPQMFDDASLDLIAERLRGTRESAIVVLSDEPGSGRSEVALAFAHKRQKEGAYDRVFVLRGTDPLRLEQDYMTMASLVAGDTGDPGDRGYLRRKVLEYLEENDGWLMVFLSVVDPAILLSVLPWRNRGHILCTASFPKATSKDLDPNEPWLKYFSVAPVELEKVAPFRVRSVFEDVIPAQLHSEPSFQRLVDEVGDTRYSTALALAWLEYTEEGASPVDRVAFVRRQIDGYIERWDAVDAKDQAPAVRAAEIQLRELLEETRWRPAEQVTDPQLEEDAFELLCRLKPFVRDESVAGTFQTVLLDHRSYGDVHDRIDDRRLKLLAKVALADRHDSMSCRYFHVSAEALNAVSVFGRAEALAEHALESALSTLLRLLTNPPPNRGLADLSFELLPHIEALSDRVGEGNQPARPFLAAELQAYAALAYLARRRSRHAALQLDKMKERLNALDKQEAVVGDHGENWEALGGQPAPDDSVKRMGKLTRAFRAAGFPQEATTYFELLRPIVQRSMTHAGTTSDQRKQIARLQFEASMAYHDLDEMQRSKELLFDARSQWAESGDPVCFTMGLSFEAELEFDSGNAADARAMAEEARADRVQLLDTSDPRERSLRLTDIARSNFLLGRIDYVEGRFHDAQRHLAQSVSGWDQAFEVAAELDGEEAPRYSRIHQITARSYLALMRALLGEDSAAQEDADHVRHELRSTPHRAHAAALIGSNVAQVYRLCGRVDEAVDIHRKALNEAERAWATGGHRAERLIRRKYADSLLDAGRPTEALDLLLGLLRQKPPPLPGPAWKVSSARILSSLGRVLIENSLSISPLPAAPSPDLAYLELAGKVLAEARALFETAAPTPQAINPAILGCLLGLVELAIRNEDANAATEYAGAALEHARAQYDNAPTIGTAIARWTRAEALRAGDDAELLTVLAAQLEPYVESKAGNPTDRFEMAVAHVELQARLWLLEPQRLPEDPLDVAKQWLEAPLDGYLSISSGQPHQLSARVYAELAALAQRLGLAEQRRARLVRECNRLRPAFSPKVNDLLYEIASRRHIFAGEG
jgi:tetratricopeptide (TPR) repeat protein